MRRIIKLPLWLALLLMTLPAAADTLYVNDILRVGVRSKPNSAESPLVVVTTGARLEVLERQGGYVKVRTAEGKEGWVNKIYLVSEPPARERLARLKEEFDRVQGELDELRADSIHTTEENDKLQERLGNLLKENSNLHEQLSEFYDEDSQSRRKQMRYVYGGLMAALFILGIYLGVRWQKQKVARRFGGLEV